MLNLLLCTIILSSYLLLIISQVGCAVHHVSYSSNLLEESSFLFRPAFSFGLQSQQLSLPQTSLYRNKTILASLCSILTHHCAFSSLISFHFTYTSLSSIISFSLFNQLTWSNNFFLKRLSHQNFFALNDENFAP